MAAIDVDGVVADVRHRLHLVAPDQWEEFFAAAEHDELLPEGAALVHRLAAEHELVWLTGRPEHLREQTEAWLREQGLPPGHLVMRPDWSEDDRPTREIKREYLIGLAQTRKLVVVVDDDPAVVDLLRAEGIPTQLATWCPYTPTYQSVDRHPRR